ncbi:MAG: HDOD domain-containing protein [Opitutaceae bacterium]|nr:HDOD domain-containing protein [Opitutaceae bacterium]
MPLVDIAKSIRAVPVAPEVLPKLQSRLQDVDTDITDLAALIRLDAGLATSVLKSSNSAYYTRGSRVTSIEEAVSVIGYEETLRIVARCSYSTVMKGSLVCYGISGEVLWEEAVLAALAMDQLSQVAECDASEAYISGLLHAVGMVAINDYLLRTGRPNDVAPTGPLDAIAQWEMHNIGHHHGKVSAAMMQQWRFASSVVLAAERLPEPAISSDDTVLSALLPLGVTIAKHVCAHPDDDGVADPEFDLARAKRAGLDRRQLVEMVATVRNHWKQTKQFLV